MEDKDYLELCKNQIQKKLGWDDWNTWKFGEYKKLNEAIFNEIGISISTHTLMRIFGKLPYDGNLQQGTKNALATFLGYSSWENYIENQAIDNGSSNIELNNKEENNKNEPKKHNKKQNIIIFIGISCLVTAAIFIQYLLPKKDAPSQKEIKCFFKVHQTNSSFPSTVFYTYSVSGLDEDDSLFIENKMHGYIQKKIILNHVNKAATNKHSEVSFRPGVYYSYLISKKNGVLDSAFFCIDTDKSWSLVKNSYYNKNLVLNNEDIIRENGYLRVKDYSLEEADKLRNSGKTSKYTQVFKYLFYIHPFKKSADNITVHLKGKFYRTASNSDFNLCSKFGILISGEDSYVEIPIVQKGCERYAWLRLSEKEYNGYSTDLPMFSVEMSEWFELSIQIKKQTATVFINNQKVYEDSYQTPLKQFFGLKIRLSDNTLLDYIHIIDSETQKPILIEDFN